MIQNPFSGVQEARIMDHMNKDHVDALKQYTGGTQATMIGIDAEGFDVLASGQKMRFVFENPVRNMEEARQALVDMARR
jgi:putative heme iron utilization protein